MNFPKRVRSAWQGRDVARSAPLGHNGPPSAFDRDGWVAVARGLRHHWLVGFGRPVTPAALERGSYSRSEAWVDLIMECRYLAGTVNNNGRKMKLEPGQLLGAVSWLANRWNWTPKTVRGFLDKLEDEGMISRFVPSADEDQSVLDRGRHKGKLATVLTVSGYSLYQLAYRNTGQDVGQVRGASGASFGADQGNIYKEETRGRGNKETTAASPNISLDELANVAQQLRLRLLEVAIGALANQGSAPGLMVCSSIVGWLEAGADPDADIIPAVRAVAESVKARGNRQQIRSWEYFNIPVAEAKARRERGLPIVQVGGTSKHDEEIRKLRSIVGGR